jgi:hypothetical protein
VSTRISRYPPNPSHSSNIHTCVYTDPYRVHVCSQLAPYMCQNWRMQYMRVHEHHRISINSISFAATLHTRVHELVSCPCVSTFVGHLAVHVCSVTETNLPCPRAFTYLAIIPCWNGIWHMGIHAQHGVHAKAYHGHTCTPRGIWSTSVSICDIPRGHQWTRVKIFGRMPWKRVDTGVHARPRVSTISWTRGLFL